MITNSEWTLLRTFIKDKRVIELGCGTCAFSNAVASETKEMVAIDIEDKSKFASNNPNLYFMRMDATKLEFRPMEFDCAVFYNTVGHLENVLEPCFNESLRVLKSGGHLLIGSSFAYDVAVLRDKVLPLFESMGYHYMYKQVGITKWVIITKR